MENIGYVAIILGAALVILGPLVGYQTSTNPMASIRPQFRSLLTPPREGAGSKLVAALMAIVISLAGAFVIAMGVVLLEG